MSSTATARRLFVARPHSGVLLGVALAAVALAGTLAQLRHGGVFPTRPGSGELDLAGVVLAAGSTLPLVAWRWFPLGGFVATAVAAGLLAGLGYSVDLVLGPTAALFLLVASRDRDSRWTGRTTAIVVGLLIAYLGATAATQPGFPGVELLHTGLAWAVAWFAGERTRMRRELVADLRDRALRTEREAERERLLAIAEERARIARDLHDSAGHAISVIAVRAGAARLRHHQDPDRSLLALAAVEQLARQTVEEIDQLVGTLRRTGSAARSIEAPAGLASLDALVAHHAAAGLEIQVDLAGTPRTLGGAADQAAYRILQEALTNAARHGTGDARVELAFADAAVELTITNPVRANCQPRAGGGHGLIGMRERATLLAGSLDAERVDGTFRVHARIPYRGHRS
ncbi:MAG: histidine kinase [Micromonosporaceae bacterium]|nr:histidine kinase [Micromonosporaceae bacterium]